MTKYISNENNTLAFAGPHSVARIRWDSYSELFDKLCVTPWVDHWVSGVRLWTNGGGELSAVGVRTGSGVLALYPVVTNRWECEADYSSATSAEFKNLWICTSW